MTWPARRTRNTSTTFRMLAPARKSLSTTEHALQIKSPICFSTLVVPTATLMEMTSEASQSTPRRTSNDEARKRPAHRRTSIKLANPNIIVQDLDHMLEKPQGLLGDSLNAIRKKYPTAWGYVWAYPAGYSKDGMSAVGRFRLAGRPPQRRRRVYAAKGGETVERGLVPFS